MHCHCLAPPGQPDTHRPSDAVGLLVGAGDGGSQLDNAVGGGVAGVAVLHGLDGGGADVLGGGEVGLAEAEVKDGDPLGPQLPGQGPGRQRRAFSGTWRHASRSSAAPRAYRSMRAARSAASYIAPPP